MIREDLTVIKEGKDGKNCPKRLGGISLPSRDDGQEL